MDNLGRLSGRDIEHKQAADFVTRVDREAEEAIIRIIREDRPGHSFLAEESIHDVASTGYRWIIDPLDGTTNFIHGFPVFSVSIALQYQRDVILAVVFDPMRDELFTAMKGRGAFLNGREIRVSATSLGQGLIATGFPFRDKKMTGPYLKLFRNLFDRISDFRRAGSAALDLSYLAAGRCDGFFEIGLSPWDVAAGSLLIREAGGIVTDFGGGQRYIETGNIVAGTPMTHAGILEEVQKVFSGMINS